MHVYRLVVDPVSIRRGPARVLGVLHGPTFRVSANAGVASAAPRRMRRACRERNVSPAAVAGIHGACCDQAVKVLPVDAAPPALHVRSVGTADIGPFVPVQSQPAEIVDDGLGATGPVARAIQVVHAQYEWRGRRSGAEPCQQRRAKVAEMEGTGGAWREAPTIDAAAHPIPRRLPSTFG